jgi:energy-converting hydrogenase Eha subunit E
MTAIGCVLLFFYADALFALLSPIAVTEMTP